LYDFYQQQIACCDAAIQAQLDRMESKGNKDTLPPRKKPKTKGGPDFDARGELY